MGYEHQKKRRRLLFLNNMGSSKLMALPERDRKDWMKICHILITSATHRVLSPTEPISFNCNTLSCDRFLSSRNQFFKDFKWFQLIGMVKVIAPTAILSK